MTKLRTIEELAAECGVKPELLAAAKMKFAWGKGKQMTREDFEAAISDTANLRLQ